MEAERALRRQAAAFKARGNMAYADCFAAVLAKNREAELVSEDKEFQTVEGEIKIKWLQAGDSLSEE